MDDGDAADDRPSTGDVDLSPDECVDEVLQGDRGPQNLSLLSGYLGESDVPGYHRLFTDPTFKRWVDIPDDAIRHRRRIPAEQDAFGGRSLVWVINGALLVTGEVTTAGAEADFLTGPLSAAAHLQPGDEAIAFAPPDVSDEAARGGSPDPTPRRTPCCDYSR